MHIIALWSNIELIRARLLARVMRSDRRLVMAMYYAVRSDEAKSEILRATAAAAARFGFLSRSDHELFLGCMLLADRTKKRRNTIAHSVFVRFNSTPDLLALAQPEDLASQNAEYEEFREIAGTLADAAPREDLTDRERARRNRVARKLAKNRISLRFDNSRVVKFTPDDLADHLRDARLVETSMGMLEHVVSRTPGKVTEARRWVRVVLYNAKPRILQLSRPPPVPPPQSGAPGPHA